MSRLLTPKISSTPLETMQPVTERLQYVAQTYDDEYTHLCKTLGDIADTVDQDIYPIRLSHIANIKAENRTWASNTRDEQRAYPEKSNALQLHRTDVTLLQRNRTALMTELEREREKAWQLERDLDQISNKLEQVKVLHDDVKERSTMALPSCQYLWLVLKRISSAKMFQAYEGAALSGFVCHAKGNDVKPFRFSEEDSKFRQVNMLWDLICEE